MPDVFYVHGVPQVTPKQIIPLIEAGAVLIDLRMEGIRNWKQFDLPEVVWAPFDRVAEIIKTHSSSDTFILAETSSSEKASRIIRSLQSAGYANVYNLAGGFVEWERGGFPVREDKTNRLSGSCMCQLKPRHKK